MRPRRGLTRLPKAAPIARSAAGLAQHWAGLALLLVGCGSTNAVGVAATGGQGGAIEGGANNSAGVSGDAPGGAGSPAGGANNSAGVSGDAPGGAGSPAGGAGGVPNRQGHWTLAGQDGLACATPGALKRVDATFQVCTGGCAPGCAQWVCACLNDVWRCVDPQFGCDPGTPETGLCSQATEERYQCQCTADAMRCEITAGSAGAAGSGSP